jgi:putative intracellular protease/amidase
MARIVMVLTSHDTLGATGRKTGFYFEELAAPYWVFRDAGHSVDLASIAGGKPPADPNSVTQKIAENAPAVARFLEDKDAMAALSRTLPIESVRPGHYEAVFFPGGHGTMWDMPGNRALAGLIGAVSEAGGAIGAVCHGPAGLLDATAKDGTPIVRNRRVTGFSNAEEESVGLTGAVPFLLETRLE